MKERPQSSKTLRWLIEPRYSETGQQISSGIAVDGREYPDGVPLAPPVGYEAPTQLEQLIEQIVRRRDFAAAVAAAGEETFEEADDFDTEDEDYDPRFEESIYEKYFEAKSRRKQDLAVEASRKSSEGSSLSASPEKNIETPKSGGDVPDVGAVRDESSRVEPRLSSSRKD